MAEMSAVDWLKDNLPSLFEDDSSSFYADLFDQAKGMEKEQIKAAYNKGYQDGEIDSLDAKDGDVQYFEDAERYYTETYGRE
jgi:hypothetical protein